MRASCVDRGVHILKGGGYESWDYAEDGDAAERRVDSLVLLFFSSGWKNEVGSNAGVRDTESLCLDG